MFHRILRHSAIGLAALAVWGLSVSSEAQETSTAETESDAAAANEEPQSAFTDEQIQFFEKEIKPILTARCFKCHGDLKKVKGGLRLTSRAGVLKGGDSGPAVSLAEPDDSLLLDAINYGFLEMPPGGKLPEKEIAVLSRWVKQGLPWTPGEEPLAAPDESSASPQVNDQTRNFWSHRPVQRPDVPTVKNATWVSGPIDAFVLSRLEQAGLTPAPPAARAVLIRRAYYDLLGLPPSPEEVRAFLEDDSPDAYEHLIDRLLDSPHYGEKWARHWLDLVRYAETNSYERDGVKPYAWRYRDYVIRSLNEDKPYTQFIREQLAGDELERPNRETIIASGYYRLGIWDDEPADRELALYDDLDDILNVTGQVFLGMTVGCARCHDHKLDPIPQKDYYRMLAFFGGLTRFGVRSPESVAERSLRPIATAVQKRRHAGALAEHEKKTAQVARKLKAVHDLVRTDFSGVEQEDFQDEVNRVALVKKRVPDLLSRAEFEQYVALTKERDRLRKFTPPALDMALCVTEVGPVPRDVHVLIRGNPHAKSEKVEPGFPSIFALPDPQMPPATQPDSASPAFTTSGRRRVLAEWIADENNPRTARVMVNRLWQYHFGRGIVRSPNDFGMQGSPPTHPELLDWLAAEFVHRGWRLKAMHKLIMLSSAYRMSSAVNPQALREDPENDLFWRFNMRRLSAEEVRDSILAVTGSLNREKMFGPSIYPITPEAVLAGQSRPGAGWGRSSPEDRSRRSIYIHVKRSLLVPVLESFDAADTDGSCPVRFSTTQPTQALGTLNGDFLNRQAKAFAEYLSRHAGAKPADQVRLALWRTTQREPSEAEIARGVKFLEDLQKEHNAAPRQALEYFCLLALNLNEFMYLD